MIANVARAQERAPQHRLQPLEKKVQSSKQALLKKVGRRMTPPGKFRFVSPGTIGDFDINPAPVAIGGVPEG